MYLFVVVAVIVFEQSGHEPRPDILKGEGGTVEQLEGENLVGYLHHRGVEVQRIGNDRIQFSCGHRFAKQFFGQNQSCFGQ